MPVHSVPLGRSPSCSHAPKTPTTGVASEASAAVPARSRLRANIHSSHANAVPGSATNARAARKAGVAAIARSGTSSASAIIGNTPQNICQVVNAMRSTL